MYALIDDLTDHPPTARVHAGTGDVRIRWGGTTLRASIAEAEALATAVTDAVTAHRLTAALTRARLDAAEREVATWPAQRLDEYFAARSDAETRPAPSGPVWAPTWFEGTAPEFETDDTGTWRSWCREANDHVTLCARDTVTDAGVRLGESALLISTPDVIESARDLHLVLLELADAWDLIGDDKRVRIDG